MTNNFLPKLSDLHFCVDVLETFQDISGVIRKSVCFSFVPLMSLLIVVTMVVLLLPTNFLLVLSSKWYPIAFVAGQSAGSLSICQSSFHLLSVIFIDSGSVSVTWLSLLFVIL